MIKSTMDRSKIDALLVTIRETGRGGFLAHETIETILCCKRHSKRWDRLFYKARAVALVGYNIAMAPERNKGYQLLLPSEHPRRAQQYLAMACQDTGRAVAVMTHVEVAELRPDERVNLIFARARVATIHLIMTNESKKEDKIKLPAFNLPTVPRPRVAEVAG